MRTSLMLECFVTNFRCGNRRGGSAVGAKTKESALGSPNALYQLRLEIRRRVQLANDRKTQNTTSTAR